MRRSLCWSRLSVLVLAALVSWSLALPSGNAEPARELLGLQERLAPILPPGWQVEGKEVVGNDIQPPGYMPAPGARIRLVHCPDPDSPLNRVGLTVYIRHSPMNVDRDFVGQYAQFMGEGTLGHILFGEQGPRPVRARWAHVASDIARALHAKPDPYLARTPVGPDWGRVVSYLLREAHNVSEKSPLLLEFAHRAETSPGMTEWVSVKFSSNASASDDSLSPRITRVKADLPFTYVSVSVRPWLPDDREPREAILWDGKSDTRTYFFNRPDVVIFLSVVSDDDAFRASINAILDNALTAAIADWRAAQGDALNRPRIGIPPGIHVSLTPDKAEYVIGEPAMVKIEVTGQAGNIMEGGDYRGAARPLRYMLRAWDENAIEATDPVPLENSMGGFAGLRPLPYSISLQLQQWCRIDQPGTYRVGVAAAWGWKNVDSAWGSRSWGGSGFGGRTYVGQFSVAFREPTPEQAAHVLQEILNLPPTLSAPALFNCTSAFRSLCHPVYLPLLKTLAESKDPEMRKLAVTGVDSILTPQATRLLLQFLNDEDARVGNQASRCLSRRMPRRELVTSGGHEAFSEYVQEQVRRSWCPELAEPALTWARESLSGGGAKARWAALLIQYLGEAKDMQLLGEAIEQAAPRWSTWRSEGGGEGPSERMTNAAERAARVLYLHGARPPTKPQGPGESVLWAVALRNRLPFRPEGWQETAAELMKSKFTVVRYKMLESMPLPIPELIVPLVSQSLHAEDGGIRCAAADLVARSGSKKFARDVLVLLRQERAEWLLRSAIKAAKAVARDEMPDIAAERLMDDDEKVVNQVFWVLVQWAVRDVTGWGQQKPIFPNKDAAAACQQRWKEWIVKNRDAVRENGGFPLGDPRLSPDLFPPSVNFHDRAGHNWPTSRPESKEP